MLWVAALTESQRRLVRLLDDKSTAVQEDNGDVVLNLQPLVIQLGDRVAILGNVAGQLPPDAGKVVIMQADQLQTAQDLTGLLRTVGTLVLDHSGAARRRRPSPSRAAAGASSSGPSRSAPIVVGLAILVTRSIAEAATSSTRS